MTSTPQTAPVQQALFAHPDQSKSVNGAGLNGGLARADEDAAFLRLTNPPPRVAGDTAPLNIVDLFAGCGGMTLGAIEGARRGGRDARLSLAIDDDPIPLEVLKKTIDAEANAVEMLDLSSIAKRGRSAQPTKSELRLLAPRDNALLLAGPPCQGHSALNNHTRHDDARNDLYLAIARVARVLEPRVIVAENVRGVGSDRRGAMTACAEQLRKLGYWVDGRRLNLHALGVPQRRVRHVLVATRDAFFDWRLEQGPERTVRWAIEDLLDQEGKTGFDTPSKTVTRNQKRITWLFENDAYDLPNSERPTCHQSDHSYVSMYGRLKWDAPAQTITSGFGSMGQGRYVHPSRPRTLTPHEAARLQFLPDFVRFGDVESRGAVAGIIGNVAPPRLTIVLVKALIEQGLL